jgi:hypothetical protein
MTNEATQIKQPTPATQLKWSIKAKAVFLLFPVFIWLIGSVFARELTAVDAQQLPPVSRSLVVPGVSSELAPVVAGQEHQPTMMTVAMTGGIFSSG